MVQAWGKCMVALATLLVARSTTLRKAGSSTYVGVDEDLEISAALEDTVDESGELSTQALLSRIDKVQGVTDAERYALQAQQQAIEGLQQMNAVLKTRMDELEAHRPNHQPSNLRDTFLSQGNDFLCSRQTGGTCGVLPCYQERGKVQCVHGSCVCEPGICADGHGRCLSSKKGRLLPKVYKIEFKSEPGRFLFMKNFPSSQSVDVSDEDEGKSSEWRVVVNNDDSIMLYTERWGPEYFLAVDMYNEYCDQTGSCSNVHHPAHREFESPWKASFELYKGHHGEMYLKYVPKLNGWLDHDSYGGAKFPAIHGAVVFHPALDEVVALNAPSAAEHTSCLVPMLLALFVGLSR